MLEKKSVSALVSGDVWSYLDVGLILMPWQKGNSREESRSFCLLGLSSGPGSNTVVDAVPLPERTGCRDGKALSALSQTAEICFPWVQISFCCQAIKPQLLDTQDFFFFTLSSSHCTSAAFSLFLHQRNSIMHGHCSRGERLWPLASPPGYQRHKGPSCILSGASGHKKKTIWRLTGHHFSY